MASLGKIGSGFSHAAVFEQVVAANSPDSPNFTSVPLPSLLHGSMMDDPSTPMLDVGVSLASCPGRKPPFLTVKRPARPYKSAIENRFT
jgi:hypothetical protein